MSEKHTISMNDNDILQTHVEPRQFFRHKIRVVEDYNLRIRPQMLTSSGWQDIDEATAAEIARTDPAAGWLIEEHTKL